MDRNSANQFVNGRIRTRYNPWWDGAAPRVERVRRDLLGEALGSLSPSRALALVGMRQAGKTTLMRQIVGRLLKPEDGTDGVSPRDILFINFDEPALLPYRSDPMILDRLVDAYRAIQRPHGRPYLFLDEVQNLDHWAHWVRTALGAEEATIVVSGSSAQLLEPELGTVLTGRTRRLTVQPFSFREFLRAREREPTTISEGRGFIQRMREELQHYLRFGGMPAVAAEPDDEGEVHLVQYFEDILNRDVVARHAVRSVRTLKEVALHLLEQTARPFSHHRLKGIHGVGVDQARDYVQHLVEAHMLRELTRYDRRPGVAAKSPRKAYAQDVGLRNAVVAQFSDDWGWLAETVVFNALKARWAGDLFYVEEAQNVKEGRAGYACDFLLWKGTRAAGAVQVSYTSAALQPRELAGLVATMKRFQLPEGLILTDGDSGDIETDGGTVRCRPLWRWLLDREGGEGWSV
ncbi:MAG: ATP-binding protein [Myxococcota bacterium]